MIKSLIILLSIIFIECSSHFVFDKYKITADQKTSYMNVVGQKIGIHINIMQQKIRLLEKIPIEICIENISDSTIEIKIPISSYDFHGQLTNLTDSCSRLLYDLPGTQIIEKVEWLYKRKTIKLEKRQSLTIVIPDFFKTFYQPYNKRFCSSGNYELVLQYLDLNNLSDHLESKIQSDSILTDNTKYQENNWPKSNALRFYIENK